MHWSLCFPGIVVVCIIYRRRLQQQRHTAALSLLLGKAFVDQLALESWRNSQENGIERKRKGVPKNMPSNRGKINVRVWIDFYDFEVFGSQLGRLWAPTMKVLGLTWENLGPNWRSWRPISRNLGQRWDLGGQIGDLGG